MRLIGYSSEKGIEAIFDFCARNGHQLVGTYTNAQLTLLMGHLGNSLNIDGVVVERVEDLGSDWKLTTSKLSAMGHVVLTTDALRVSTTPVNCQDVAKAMNRSGIRQADGSLWYPSAIYNLISAGGGG